MKRYCIFLVIIFCNITQLLAADFFDSKDIDIKDRINGNIKTSLFNDYVYESASANNGYSKNYAEVYTNLNLKINNNLSLKSAFQLKELVKNSSTGQIKTGYSFEDEGIITEELKLTYDNDKFSLFAGKFLVNFGQGWNWQNGIWGYNFAEDQYRMSEKLGFGTVIRAGDKNSYGGYSFTFDVFTNDTKNLDNSMITKRDDHYNIGGNPGDKRGLTSYSMSMDVDFVFSKKEELSYHFSYLNLAVNDRQSAITKGYVEDQKGYAANINYKYIFSDYVSMDGLLEYVAFENFEGNINKNADFLNANLMLSLFKDWRLIATHIQKQELEANSNGVDTSMTEFSAGYYFGQNSILNGFSVLLGHRSDMVDNKITVKTDNTIGFMIRYFKEF